MSLAESYTREIRDQIHRFATWEPGVRMELGDFGELRGAQFVRLGNLDDLGIGFDERASGGADQVSYTSDGSVEFGLGGGADAGSTPVADARATLKVDFGARHALLFTAADVEYRSVDDHMALQEAILGRFRDGAWDARHAVVTEIARSGSTTVIVSAGDSASIELEAEAGVEQIDLADASLRAHARSERNIGYRAITESGMTPLLGLSRVRPAGLFWWRRTELRKQLGFAPLEGADEPDVEPGFQRRLDDHLDTLRSRARRTGTMDRAFEWAELQPRDPPVAPARR